ncbi:MAG: tRNA nucleotidyltransferase [Spongiibacteraceae bacterium]|jgi:tRNA nucleotidyltransferase (CCA-adding enzyme)|nr:tRNA nucleotidyltransferase [Spongiibacteraceae bacterium]
MQCFLVGGAVRDTLLGYPVAERDWVVVGSTPEEMTAAGFTPVGRDFPVFLHPETHEEYALARTERKVGRGYRGFTCYSSPDVTLEQDLSRRDLTINAMAMDEAGNLIDPYGGQRDLEARLLRHVSPAFAEDPLRLLRVARFAARYHHLGFTVAPETHALMRTMVDNGEVDFLVPERTWKEVVRALDERHPSRFFAVLNDCGALAAIAPELLVLDAADWSRLDAAVTPDFVTQQRFAVLTAPLAASALTTLSTRWRCPNDYRELAVLVINERHAAGQARHADVIFELLKRSDALRRPERFELFLGVCQLLGEISPATRARLSTARSAAAAVNARDLEDQTLKGPALGAALQIARIDAVAESLRKA